MKIPLYVLPAISALPFKSPVFIVVMVMVGASGIAVALMSMAGTASSTMLTRTGSSAAPAIHAIYSEAVLHGTASWELAPPDLDEIRRRITAILKKKGLHWKKFLYMSIGVVLFTLVYYSPPWPDAINPDGKASILSTEGKGAIAVFLFAATWWVFEVIPIGVTSLAIGVLQVLFMIRPADKAFNDFMDPNVLFIFGSIVVGLVFTKTGLTTTRCHDGQAQYSTS